MTSHLALARMLPAAQCGRMCLAGRGRLARANNNRNNASLPRAGD